MGDPDDVAGTAQEGPLAEATPRGVRRWVVISVALLPMVGALGLAGLAVWQGLRPTKPKTALEILEEVRAEVIPAEGAATNYGVSFSLAGYEALVAWKDQYPVDRLWATDYEALDIVLPCCDVAHPFADETKNCTCGHHQALYGLAKKLLTVGMSGAAVQAEVERWTAYMYPQETLTAEMKRRAVNVPAINQALQELIEKGEC